VLYFYVARRHLHSFPTQRSSDLLMSTLFYWIGMFARGQAAAMERIGSRLVWVAVTMALVGTMVRWYESYLIVTDIGHIPVSNLRSEEHTSELQSRGHLVCRLLLE